jgi:hypothetical protein
LALQAIFSPDKQDAETMASSISYDECLLLCGAVITGILFIMTLGRPT